MLDPTIAAAIVTASGGILEKILELSGNSEPNKKARKVIDETYDELTKEVTTHSLRVLLALRQAGSNQAQFQIRNVVQPMSQRQEPNSPPFEEDLTYRLKFLCLLGLVQPVGGSEYAITHFGTAFINKARDDSSRYTLAFIA
jgi:hypothetical protein